MGLSVLIGFSLVILLAVVGKTQLSWLNGLIPLFPVFSLIAQTSIFLSRGDSAYVKEAAVIGLFSVIPFAAYLLSIIVFIEPLGFPKAATVGVFIWLFIAGIIVCFKQQII